MIREDEVSIQISRSLEGAPQGAINRLSDGFPVKQLDHIDRCAFNGCWEQARFIVYEHENVKNMFDFIFSSFDWRNQFCVTHADFIEKQMSIGRSAGKSSEFTLYRHFDENDGLLYVGVTNDPGVRCHGHRRSSDWWDTVVKTIYERFGNRSELLEAERKAIKSERPKYNVVHNRRLGV